MAPTLLADLGRPGSLWVISWLAAIGRTLLDSALAWWAPAWREQRSTNLLAPHFL